MPKLMNRLVCVGEGDLFSDLHLAGPFAADFIATVVFESDDMQSIVLLLDKPFVINAQLCQHAVASTRHQGSSFSSLLERKGVLSAITLVPADRFSEQNPFDVSWWRGGNAAIATIQLSELQ